MKLSNILKPLQNNHPLIYNINMRIISVAVFLLLLVQNQSYAQQFQPGYILSAEKDTIQGFILEQIDSKLVDKMEFRRNMESKIQTFTASEIKGFGFNYGRVFHSFKFTDIASKKDRVVFVKEVETGKIDVLIWRLGKNRKPDMFLVNNTTNDTVHLTRPRKKLMKTNDGKQYSQEDKNYLRLLNDIKGEGFTQKEIRYNENKIRRDILKYNREFEDQYEALSYKEKKEREYIILGGAAVDYYSFQDRPRIRAAVIQSRTAVERTNTLSYISGIFYSYREIENVQIPPYKLWEGQVNFRRQLLSFIPIGLMLQTRPASIRGYAYAGGGLAVVKLDDHIVKNVAIQGRDTKYAFGPTLVAGAGVKFRLGSNYLVTEIAPASSGLYLNLGYSF